MFTFFSIELVDYGEQVGAICKRKTVECFVDYWDLCFVVEKTKRRGDRKERGDSKRLIVAFLLFNRLVEEWKFSLFF